MAQCPNCGAIASAKFCPNCGTQIPQTPPVAAAAVPPQPTPPPAYPTPGQPAYPNAYPNAYQQMPPQKSGNPFKLIGIIIGGLLAVVLGLFLVLGSGPVGTPVITDQVDAETMEPLRELAAVAPTAESIYAAVEVDVDKGQTLTAKWYYEGRLQEQVNTDLTLDDAFSGWVSFKINNGGKPWPAGQFKVEIYLDGELEQTAEFAVK
jgi:hypothetical protein